MKRNHQWVAATFATVFLFALPGSAAVIVFDPTNFGVNVEQVAHHLELIARLDRQIRNQLRMLENWRFSRLSELLASMEQVTGTLDGVVGVDLPGRYPVDENAYAARDATQMADLRRQWLASHRAAVVLARSAQNQIVAEMPTTQQRIGEYLEHSRSAPGQTAVLQASNETIATLAAQLQSLQALELSESRVELEAEARRQAEATFQRQRRATLMRDWEPQGFLRATGAPPVRPPFGNS